MRPAEVTEKELSTLEKANLPGAKTTEWAKMISTGSVRVHVGADATKIIAECGPDRVLKSRFVITRPDDLMKVKQGLVKSGGASEATLIRTFWILKLPPQPCHRKDCRQR